MSPLPHNADLGVLGSSGSGGLNFDCFEIIKLPLCTFVTKGSFNLWYPYNFSLSGILVSNKAELCAISTLIPFAIAVASQNSQQALPASAKCGALL